MANIARPSQLFVFGAGASVPYGLPTWDELKNLLPEAIMNAVMYAHISNDVTAVPMPYKQTLVNVVNNVGKGLKHPTIDKGISDMAKEMKGSDEALRIQKIFFDIIDQTLEGKFDVFCRDAKEGKVEWIERLLQGDSLVLKNATFISFNYDRVFLWEIEKRIDNILKHTPNGKVREEVFKKRAELYTQLKKARSEDTPMRRSQDQNGEWVRNLHSLESEFKRIDIEAQGYENQRKDEGKPHFPRRVFFPHGVGHKAMWELEKYGRAENAETYMRKMAHSQRFSKCTAVSCHDVWTTNYVYQRIERTHIGAGMTLDELYAIGLGDGLKTNLDKINLKKMGIKRVFYTCYEEEKEKYFRNYFLQKCGVQESALHKFKDCDEFVSAYLEMADEWQ